MPSPNSTDGFDLVACLAFLFMVVLGICAFVEVMWEDLLLLLDSRQNPFNDWFP